MKIFQTNLFKYKLTTAFFLLIFVFGGNAPLSFAHGDEDHGDEKPKTTATDQGTVLHVTRLGSLEVSLKHPLLVPDTATTARLFVTKFETNEPDEKVKPAVEIEAANGAVIQATVEKSETAGIYTVKFPALQKGTYTIRAKLTYDGETDTTVFSGIEVTPATVAPNETGGMGWGQTLLIGFIFLTVLALFGGLVYFVLRSNESELMKKETVSA